MSYTESRPRPRPRSQRSGALFVGTTLLACCAAVAMSGVLAPVAGQAPDTIPPLPGDTIPPDTVPPVPPDTIPPVPPDTIPPVPPDTIPPVPPDTIPPVPPDTVPPVPPDTVPADTVPPEPPPDPAQLPPMDQVGATGWAAGVWEWRRADLQRFPDLSLLHLLERIPGIVPVRVTSVGQPEAGSVFGATAGAITYEVDGFVLDPLTAPTFDPSRFPLLALESVRVERRVTGATVRIRTLSPTEPSAHSIIEAGTGDYRTNLFRGTFLGPHVLGGALALGFESLGAQLLPGGASNHVAGSLKWTWSREETGIQVEYRQSTMDRTGVAQGLSGTRRDWVVRARDRFGPVTAEAYAGGSAVEDDLGDVVLREGAPQGGIRLRSRVPAPVPVEGTAALRFRGHPRLPTQELELGAWSEPTTWLGMGVELVHGRWAERPSTGHWSARAQAGPLVGLTAFAEFSSAARALVTVPPAPDPVDPGPGATGWIDLPRTGARAGAEFRRGGLHLGAAFIRATADSVPGFGLAFDPDAPRFVGGEANGFEANVRLPTGWSPLRVEGWYVSLEAPPAWPYMPGERWRAALVYHDLPLPSGNLEIYARVEHEVRGAMSVPAEGTLAAVDAYGATNIELTIRILTVRAFLRWQNVFNRPFQEDVPGFQRPGQHALYGVKWEFWN